jgi:hypothetical protein
MDESAYSTLLKYVENTEYTENLTESEKRKLRKQAKHYVSKDKLARQFWPSGTSGGQTIQSDTPVCIYGK